MTKQALKTETQDKVGIITLDRPDALNALNAQLCAELVTALHDFDADPAIGCIVITGSEKAFAAGADIKEMAGRDFAQNVNEDFFGDFARGFAACATPVIAAVSGYALGAGCELAMICDILIAADTAKFGQPEITIGTIPGLGGTQRLTRRIGSAKAMELCLTGRIIDADEAERAGLVSRVVAADTLMAETLKTARTIAGHSRPITRLVKEAVNQALETPLTAGLAYERRLFHASFATADQKEGMQAFIEKRDPKFKDR